MATLTIAFDGTSPNPANGYRVRYRAINTSAYTTVSPNPTGSPVTITGLPEDTAYEGLVESDCGGGRYSQAMSFTASMQALTDPLLVVDGDYETVVSNQATTDPVLVIDGDYETVPVTSANYAPVLVNPMGDVLITQTGTQKRYLPAGQYLDPGDTITKTARVWDGTNESNFPAGISFDPSDGEGAFIIDSSAADVSFPVRVIATDTAGNKVPDVFHFEVARVSQPVTVTPSSYSLESDVNSVNEGGSGVILHVIENLSNNTSRVYTGHDGVYSLQTPYPDNQYITTNPDGTGYTSVPSNSINGDGDLTVQYSLPGWPVISKVIRMINNNPVATGPVIDYYSVDGPDATPESGRSTYYITTHYKDGSTAVNSVAGTYYLVGNNLPSPVTLTKTSGSQAELYIPANSLSSSLPAYVYFQVDNGPLIYKEILLVNGDEPVVTPGPSSTTGAAAVNVIARAGSDCSFVLTTAGLSETGKECFAVADYSRRFIGGTDVTNSLVISSHGYTSAAGNGIGYYSFAFNTNLFRSRYPALQSVSFDLYVDPIATDPYYVNRINYSYINASGIIAKALTNGIDYEYLNKGTEVLKYWDYNVGTGSGQQNTTFDLHAQFTLVGNARKKLGTLTIDLSTGIDRFVPINVS